MNHKLVMKKFIQLILFFGLFLFARPVEAASVGDPAAPLEVGEWLKGAAVDLAEMKGKGIVVVEFWATWCGPCVASIPHLSALQRKYADRGVVVVGVTSEAAPVARPFVEKMGGQMDYVVAVDAGGKTTAGYLKAFGVNGIPHAFVVGRDGRIAWHGHPQGGLDKELEKLLGEAVVVDPAVAGRELARRKLVEFEEMAARGGDVAVLDALEAELVALDRKVGGIEPGKVLDVKALRRSSRFQSLMRAYQRAVAAGRPADELAGLEREAALLAPEGFRFEDYRGQFNLQRAFQDYYREVTGGADGKKVAELRRRLEWVSGGDAGVLSEMAWTLLTDASVKVRDAKLAAHLAKVAVDVSGGRDAEVLDTYGRALFELGDRAGAVRQLEEAVRVVTDAGRKKELEAVLAGYRNGKAP